MIILHAGLLEDRLLIWGETPVGATEAEASGRGRKSRSADAPRLPYDAGEPALLSLVEDGSLGFKAKTGAVTPERVFIWLPTVGGMPVASSPLIAAPPEPSAPVMLAAYRLTALTLTAEQAVALLCSCVGRDTLAPGLVVGSSLAYWATVLRFTGALVARQQFLPGLVETPTGWRAVWEPVFSGSAADRLAKLAASMPSACRALARDAAAPPQTPALLTLSEFSLQICDHLVRSASEAESLPAASLLSARQSSRAGRQPAFHSTHDQWLYALRAQDSLVRGDEKEMAALVAQIREWRRPLSVTIAAPFRLCFRLEEPVLVDEDEETPAGGWYVRYLLQSVEDPSLLIPVDEAWAAKGRTKTLLQRGGFAAREYLLTALGQASKIWPPIEASLKTAVPTGSELDTNRAYGFLTETAWMLEQAGFTVLLPAWWTRKGTKLRLTARANVKSPAMQANAGLSLNTIVQFDWQLALGGESLTLAELEELARHKASLVRLRGQWVQLDASEIEAALDFWKKRGETQVTAREAVRLALGAEQMPGGLVVEGVQADGWFGDLLAQMESSAALAELPVPDCFRGSLRPYQHRGYSWLSFLGKWGFGACLADDMGLGKTPTALAHIQKQWQEGEKRPALVICPTSVVGNWHREAQRFTPDLPVMVHHGTARVKGESFQQEAARHALVLSSFALLYRDLDALKAVEWSGVILDEAQNIKNPETRQSKAARALPADWRIALTGTPVENHVGDLWAIMDFLNPGLLGSQSEFRRAFFTPIQANRDPEATERLKRITGPFLLRRVKTDKAIIADLPEKMEMKVFCNLTREQASLYEAVVKEAEEQLEDSEGIQYKGVVLATLSRLKQVCNHPAQFLGDNSAIAGRSGKLARLTEMLEEVLAAGDKALIFSQFAEMGEIIRRHLQETFGKEALFLHGGVPKKQRDRMVERFQAEGNETPFFILSLKAGGVGLNLTAANHVFHFDRWWNPAVENQATDRAFRIGQKKNVQVHKFLCAGTLEEKIDALIESKRQIAADVVGTGEGWLTELSTAELKELFALRKDAVGD